MKLKQHLFITGFMGSGKSTLGKKTAALLNCHFIDLDVIIEQKANKPISRIFEEEGENKFRELESICLSEAIKQDPCVISLGGGTVCFNNNLELIKRSGILIYIQLPSKVLADRIAASKEKRPLLDNLHEQERLSTIEQLLEKRKPFYEQAHITLNGLNLNPQLIQSSFFDYSQKHNL